MSMVARIKDQIDLQEELQTALMDAAALKAEALRLGAADVGLAEADNCLTAELPYLQDYLAAGAQGGMAYLSRSPETRCRPDTLLPGARTVVVCAFSYFPRPDLYAYHPRIAYFAQGEDYHRIIRRFLKQMTAYVTARYPDARCRGCVDTAPILEKAWAVRAGLGRIGRNDLLQHPRLGSYLFLGILLIDRPADSYDRPVTPEAITETRTPSSLLPETCLKCRACVEACPTGALSFAGRPRLHATRCLSYVTIEERVPAVPVAAAASGDETSASSQPSAPIKTFPSLYHQTDADKPSAIFGCDRCQTACPVNRRLADTVATPAHKMPEPHPAFVPSPDLAAMSRDDFAHLDEADFRQRFARSPLKRAGADGLKANLALW